MTDALNVLNKIKNEKKEEKAKDLENKEKALRLATKYAVSKDLTKDELEETGSYLVDRKNAVAIRKDAIADINDIKETLLEELSADLEIGTIPNDINEVVERVKRYLIKCRGRFSLPTISGLARVLGITRKEMLDFNALKNIFEPQIADFIFNRVKPIVEEVIEEKLLTEKANSNLQFYLKNNFKSWDNDNKDNNIVIRIGGGDDLF